MSAMVRFAMPLALLVVLAPRPCVAKATRVVFTIDVESNEVHGLPDQLDATCSPNQVPCGLAAISGALKARGWSGTYFLNVYEHKKWGEAAMRAVAERLRGDGQDLALHTHPQWAYDPQRWAMSDYTLDEQTAIIKDGVQRLSAWSGQPVVAHRTGAYAADRNTLIALERNDVLLDSSIFWQHANTRLDALGLPHNAPSRYGHLLEVPVTVYQRADTSDVLGFRLPPVITVRKIDPNWFVNEAEMRSALDQAVRADLPLIVVFLHSFSFMGDRSGGTAIFERHAWDLFVALLEDIDRRHLPVVTLRQIASEPISEATVRDVVPQVVVPMEFKRYLWHTVKAADRLTVGLAAITVLLLVTLTGVVARKRSVRRRVRSDVAPTVLPKARFQ